MKQRDCFFNKSAPGIPSHLWVVLSDPAIDPDNVVIVNLTDSNSHHDHSCLLNASDHSGVFTKPSCIAYQFAKVTSVAVVTQALKQGLLRAKKPVPTAAFQKIINGAQETDELRNAPREILREQLLIS